MPHPADPADAILRALLAASSIDCSLSPEARRSDDIECEVRHLPGGQRSHRRVLDLLLNLPSGAWHGMARGGIAALLHNGRPVRIKARRGAEGDLHEMGENAIALLRDVVRALGPDVRLQAQDLTAHERLALVPWRGLATMFPDDRDLSLHRRGRVLVLVSGIGPRARVHRLLTT